jgi:alanine racemase
MTMVDVTGVPCQRGDVATLIGRDGDEHLDLNVLAERVDVLAYELLVGLRLRVPRIARGQTA